MTTSIDFTSYYELLALHRALMEAKFHDTPNDPAVAGSPFVADVANRIVEILANWKQSDRPAGHDWPSWRHVGPGHREWAVAIDRAREATNWITWNEDERRQFAKILLSPFVATSEVLEQFIACVNADKK